MSKRKKSPKSHKSGRGGNQSINVRTEVKSVFTNNPDEAFSYRGVIKSLGVRDAKTKDKIKDELFKLEHEEVIRRNRDGRWVTAMAPTTYEGIVDHVNPRFAYVMVEGMEEDVYVRTDDLAYAIDGDLVNLLITKHSSKSKRPEGRVASIAERRKKEFVGRIEHSEKFSFVVPDNRNIHFDVFLFPEKTKQANHNDKVVVEIDKWHDRGNKSPLGHVTEVLGPAGENDAEIHSIMAEYGLPFRFTESVEQAAEKIPVEIDKNEFDYRRDFRDVTTFTIDPVDAKDFDDALSIKSIGKDKYEIGIHIADVSHYVKPGSVLDKEAIERATSVYLVDRTIPMLPEKLSNGLCSLRPNEEKCTFSAVFEINSEGKVSGKWFGRSVIYSDRRFSYEEAQECIETGEGDFAEEIITLNNISKIIRDARFKNGAVNFDTVEVRFKLDEDGKPLEVVPKVRKDAHKMIEEFMLLANREVATYIYKKKEGRKPEGECTFVYRSHDDPDPEKLDNFSKFAGRFGHKFLLDGNISKNLNKLIDEIEGKPEQNVLESLAIRAMAKAKYTTDPKGHFGLSFEHYTHFTSPIRRYPDVMVHRLLWHYLEGNKSPEKESYEKLCEHSSEREKRASEAERASVKYKQVEFMQTMLGEVFEGIVSGVTEWGVFVEITSTKCEGMIRINDLDDDYYEYDEKNYRIIGKRNGRIISLGDKLNVQVVKTDIDRRTIDLSLVAEELEKGLPI
ncbi:MAG: ribonuclease R [Cyclobacteriaceae bacterium]